MKAMKPLVILLVNTGFWSVGEIGRQIIRRFGKKYNFLFLPESVIARRPDILNEALLRADLVCCMNESGMPVLLSLRSALVTLPPVITWIHHVTSWSEEHEAAAQNSDILIAVTPEWRDRIASFAPNCRVENVKIGVDLDFYTPKSSTRAQLGLPEAGFMVGFFGARASDDDGGRKGMDTLLSVLRCAGKEVPQLHAVLVGPGWDQFTSESKAAGSNATNFGFVPRSEIPALYSILDVYLVTARVEGGPMTVLESLACGTPVVSTRVGLVPDVVVEGINGFSSDIGDVESLANHVKEIANNPELKKSLKSAARESVEGYSWMEMLGPFESLLDELILYPLRRESLPSLRWIEDNARTQRVFYAAECLAKTIGDYRKKRASLLLSLRTLRSMLDGSTMTDCVNALTLLYGHRYAANTTTAQQAKP